MFPSHDIEASTGTEINSLSDGIVVFSGNDPKFGNLIVVKSRDKDIFMAYSHMNDLIIRKNEEVVKDQVIGHIGETGDVSSPQLHFAIRQGKQPIDPLIYSSR